MEQLGLAFAEKKRRGGARVGAGRKRRAGGRRNTPHRARARHRAAEPVHVTMRARFGLLRRQRVARAVLGALRDSNRAEFRVVHYSVQANHVHLIVEAKDKAHLSAGMRGLAVRLARRVNRLLSARGKFWADRWHGNSLSSPRQVRNALVYVLQNHRKHAPADARSASGLDPLSSATTFDGFTDSVPLALHKVGPPCTVEATSWLLRIGWRRHGLIRSDEAPRAQKRSYTRLQRKTTVAFEHATRHDVEPLSAIVRREKRIGGRDVEAQLLHSRSAGFRFELRQQSLARLHPLKPARNRKARNIPSRGRVVPDLIGVVVWAR